MVRKKKTGESATFGEFCPLCNKKAFTVLDVILREISEDSLWITILFEWRIPTGKRSEG